MRLVRDSKIGSRWQRWVKLGQAQIEHILSALPPIATDARTSSIGGFVPRRDITTAHSHPSVGWRKTFKCLTLHTRVFVSRAVALEKCEKCYENGFADRCDGWFRYRIGCPGGVRCRRNQSVDKP